MSAALTGGSTALGGLLAATPLEIGWKAIWPSMVAAALRQAFLQADRAAAGQVWRQVADQLRPRWPKLASHMDASHMDASHMDESEHDVLAYLIFPIQHRTKLHGTNPLEWLNKEAPAADAEPMQIPPKAA